MNKVMSSEEYYASELRHEYLDAQADAGDFFLEESGFQNIQAPGVRKNFYNTDLLLGKRVSEEAMRGWLSEIAAERE
jgi:hypothetical protein